MLKKCTYLSKFNQKPSTCWELGTIFLFQISCFEWDLKGVLLEQGHLVDVFGITYLKRMVEMAQSRWIKLNIPINKILWRKMCSTKRLGRQFNWGMHIQSLTSVHNLCIYVLSHCIITYHVRVGRQKDKPFVKHDSNINALLTVGFSLHKPKYI